MKDTPPAVERRFREMLLERSGEGRLKMGCSMHATARKLAKAALLQQHSGARPAQLKRLLFLHFYSADIAPDERDRIASVLAKRRERNKAPRGNSERSFEAAGATNSMRVAERPARYGIGHHAKRRK